ncbi:helix-turn-helix domain-containing protein [Allomuricauda sp. R78024]|uniref:helix-turn-helix domain-containing protein n=1 Tax=Allomuricauda sp. R78024 TaxID=3093867 RepID=UPI0037CA6725
MISRYTDNYYDHFSKYSSKKPPIFEKDRSYLMRFCTQLTNYRFDNSNLTIVYFKEGCGEFLIDNKGLKIDADKFMVVNPGQSWEYVNPKCECIDVLSLVVTNSFIEQFDFFTSASPQDMLDNPYRHLTGNMDFIEQALVADNYRSGRQLKNIHKLSNSSEYLNTCPDELCIEVLQAIFKDQRKGYELATQIEAKKPSTKVETLRRLLIANDYINDNLKHAISLDELSRVSALSRFHIYSSFKIVYGQTPHQYINNLKMAKAERYVREGQFSISEIADLFGYNDASVFGKVFKKVFGQTPSDYRINT